ncbi:MAG: ArsC family transcriptional regulator [Treponema sp.]|nr:ArsC family transcriptional regulator [Treponema sp.]
MIQIFGTNKNFDTKKAQMWFKERRIDFQFVDLKEKGLSAGELESVITVLKREEGSRDAAIEKLIDKNNKDYSSIAYLDNGEKAQKLLDNQSLLKQPICRNGKDKATVGLNTSVWESWKNS